MLVNILVSTDAVAPRRRSQQFRRKNPQMISILPHNDEQHEQYFLPKAGPLIRVHPYLSLGNSERRRTTKSRKAVLNVAATEWLHSNSAVDLLKKVNLC